MEADIKFDCLIDFVTHFKAYSFIGTVTNVFVYFL